MASSFFIFPLICGRQHFVFGYSHGSGKLVVEMFQWFCALNIVNNSSYFVITFHFHKEKGSTNDFCY